MSDPTPLHWPRYLEPIDCWLCAGIFEPPCPFHPEATPASVLHAGFRRYANEVVRSGHQRRLAENTDGPGSTPGRQHTTP
jgi:hypothetical protein